MSEAFAPGVSARTIDLGAIGGILAGRRGFSAGGPVSAPRSFSPAEPGSNPTAGWDMFAAEVDPLGLRPEPVVQPMDDGGRAASYAEGYAAGETAARAAAAADASALAGLGDALARLQPFDRDALARRLNQTVLHLVETLVGEVTIEPDRIMARVRAAAALVVDATQPAILRLHPDDLALVEGRVPEPLFAIADASIARGGLLIETKDSVVEDGPATWLAALTQQLERIAPPTVG